MALLCSVLGIYLVLRRLVLIGVALPQASAAGVAAVFWLTGHGHSGADSTHLLALAGSLAATFGALGLLVAGQRRARSPAEWGVGALFAISSAATILFVALNPKGDIEMASLLRGELLAITVTDLKAVGGVLLAVGALFFLFRRDLLLTSFDPEFSRTIGRDPVRFDLLLYFLIGGAIALGVMTVGPLVVFGFLVLPALAALRVAPGLGSAFAISAAVAALSFLGGFGISYRADLPAGPVCVAVAAACWAVASLGDARAREPARRRAAAARRGSRDPARLRVALRSRRAAPVGAAPARHAARSPRLASDRRAALRERHRAAAEHPAGLPRRRGARDRQSAGAAPLHACRMRSNSAPPSSSSGAASRWCWCRWSRSAACSPARRRAARSGGRRGACGLRGPRAHAERCAASRSPARGCCWCSSISRSSTRRAARCCGPAPRPGRFPIPSALTWQEILLDAGPPIFADAFGNL